MSPAKKTYQVTQTENDTGTLLSDVTPQEVPWLWYPRLAIGKITMLDGDPGLGKSLIGADLGARVTRGAAMPDGTPCMVTGGVVVIMPEDTLHDTILPRFARAGANLSKVIDLSTVEADEDEDEYYEDDEDGDGGKSRRSFQLQSDLDQLEAAIRRVDAKLVFIDPIMAVSGSTNMYKDDDVRTLLSNGRWGALQERYPESRARRD
jgi:AAA domain